MATLAEAADLAREEQGLAVVSTLRADGTIQSSVVNAGLDPDNLPTSDPSKMNFGNASAKAWRDIWGCGQGIGGIREVPTAGALVDRLVEEYAAARRRVAG